MHLKRLTIHNIASIEDAIIDFEATPLSDAEVFLITGRTGAGKSTILDAICLALYADTPRLDNSLMQGTVEPASQGDVKLSDPRVMLRRNTGEGYVELDFTGSDGIAYRAWWGVARARKKPTGKLQGREWRLTRLDSDTVYTKVADIRNVMAEAIGLDFQQFCRTTMLAQGEFARFLNSRDEEKSAILEKITGTEVYTEIGRKVYEITREHEAAYNRCKRKAEDVRLLTDAEFRQLLDESEALMAEVRGLDAARLVLRDTRAWRIRVNDLERRLDAARNTLATARQAIQTPEFEANEKVIADWNASAEARALLGRKEETAKELERQRHNLDELADYYARLLGALSAHERYVANEMKQVRDYEKICHDITALEKELEEIDADTIRSRRESTLKQLNDVVKALNSVRTLNAETLRRENMRTELETVCGRLSAETERELVLNGALTQAAKARDTATDLYERQRMSMAKAAVDMRAALKKGDTCPVCLQRLADDLPHEGVMQSMFSDTTRHMSAAREEYDRLTRELAVCQTTMAQLRESMSRLKRDLDNDHSYSRLMTAAEKACTVCGIDAADKRAEAQLVSLEITLRKTEETDTPLLTRADEILKKLRTLKNSSERLRNAAAAAEKSNASLLLERAALHDVITLMPEWEQLTPFGSQSFSRLIENTSVLMGKIRAAQELIETQTRRLEQHENDVRIWTETHPEITATRLEYLKSLSTATLDRIAGTIKLCRNNVVGAESALGVIERQLTEAMNERPESDQAEMTQERLTADLDALDREINNRRQQIGALQQRMDDDRLKRESLAGQQKEIERLRNEWLRRQALNELIGDSTGTKFRLIAQSYVLDTLIQHANFYMTALTERYTLEVTPGTFIISIVDAWQGYTRRVASTLSGGESFLVSLALALALSDIGSRLAVDTLFIDEGFGSLSGEALSMAIETLRGLHNTSGRKVGIISHVEALRERINVQVRVSQPAGSSSSIIEIGSGL